MDRRLRPDHFRRQELDRLAEANESGVNPDLAVERRRSGASLVPARTGEGVDRGGYVSGKTFKGKVSLLARQIVSPEMIANRDEQAGADHGSADKGSHEPPGPPPDKTTS